MVSPDRHRCCAEVRRKGLHGYDKGEGLLLCRRSLYDGVSSSVRRLACGVPQGSVLGPLLFQLYTADVGELAASLGLSSHFYADDSQLYTWGNPSSDGLQRRRMELGV